MKQTLTIDNFRGSMTAYFKGDVNSGFSYVNNVFGADPISKPGSLTWCEDRVQIDEAGAVITDLIMAAKERVESGILYVYAIGHTGRLYKIQVNDPSSYNPDLDNPVLLTTLTSGSPTFKYGASIEFYGATEKIFIGHDKGVTKVNFAGTGETFVGVAGSYTANVPRPVVGFKGKLYYGNGTNLVEINYTELVTTYAKIDPAFPSGTQVRDLDMSPDGTYIDIVVSRLALDDITAAAQDTTQTASMGSYIFKWNGIDAEATAFTTFPSFSLGSNIQFQGYQYTFGTDQFGVAVFNPYEKKFSLQECQVPLPNAIMSSGNLVAWMSPLSFDGVLEADLLIYGSFDFETGPGYWDWLSHFATGDETDVVRVPCMIPISNYGLGTSSNGYPNAVYGTSKIYFSSLETSSAPTTAYRFYKWSAPSASVTSTAAPQMDAVYQTQTQIFSKKMNISEVRIYGEPWVAGNSFQIDLIGSAGTAISGGTYTFTAGTTLTVGNDYAWYNPDMAPTPCLGIMVTQKGTTNHTIYKIEVDINDMGK